MIREIEKRLAECRSGIRLVASPHNFIIRNLGPDVNSASEDYAPITNADENILVFTSRRPEHNVNPDKTPEGKHFEDIYFTRRENASWSSAQNIGPPVNTKYHDSDLALSADGKQLFLYTDQNEGDILVSRLINGKWSIPERLPWPVNTQYHESSVSVTADGRKLFVASERPGGRGGSDIYVFEKRSTGQWSPAVNLGAAINTEWDEDSPFIDYDGNTLYFSSTGHNTMGGHDIFRTRDSLGKWTPPENLGYPINTPGHDSYFISTQDGKGAYYSSVRPEGFGAEDIYHITLPEEFVRKSDVPAAFTETVEPLSCVVHFNYGSSDLDESQKQLLKKFVTELRERQNYRIQIDGHTDNIGMESSNQELSMMRAKSVKSFLESMNLPSDRLFMHGYGAGRPVSGNDQEKAGRELNRRVEVRVISN